MDGRVLFTFYLDIHKESHPEIIMEIAVIDSVSIVLFQILSFMYQKNEILLFLGLFQFQVKRASNICT